MKNFKSLRVAIVYDRVNKWGGAERVLLALHRIFPNAHLFTSVYNEKKAPWAKVFRKIKSSYLQNFPLASSFHQFYATLMPLAFESFSFDDFDLVISLTSEAAKGIVSKPGTHHICYLLTPTRYLWSGYKKYFENSFFRVATYPIVSYLRTWDKIASLRPDTYVSISKEVQRRIKKYYGRESKVIYPPIVLRGPAASSPPANARSRNTDLRVVGSPSSRVTPQDYFLVVSRLVPYKRVDIAIKACNKLNLPLKIVGTGSQEWFLKLISGPTVEFLGQLTDRELISVYRNCRALIFPGLEDFGLTIAEAQAFGRPVIAYKGGGAFEIIKPGITGEFFNKEDPESLRQVLEKWDDKRYNRDSCRKNAQRFLFENFKREFLKALNTV